MPISFDTHMQDTEAAKAAAVLLGTAPAGAGRRVGYVDALVGRCAR